MLAVVACELVKPACATRSLKELALLLVTLACSLLLNMAAGFLLGIGWHIARGWIVKLKLEKNP